MIIETDLLQLFEVRVIRERFNTEAQETGSNLAIAYWTESEGRYVFDIPCSKHKPHTHYSDDGVRLPGCPNSPINDSK